MKSFLILGISFIVISLFSLLLALFQQETKMYLFFSFFAFLIAGTSFLWSFKKTKQNTTD